MRTAAVMLSAGSVRPLCPMSEDDANDIDLQCPDSVKPALRGRGILL